MMKAWLLNLFVFSYLLISCQSPVLRSPSYAKAEFDEEKVALLRWAVQKQILFQIDDAVFADVKSDIASDECKKLESPIWSEVAYKTLSNLRNNPELQDKIHIIEIKQAQEPYVGTSLDLDGLTYLIIGYKKIESKTVINSEKDIPCDAKLAGFLNQEKKLTHYEMPNSSSLVKIVRNLPKRELPDRWKFKTDFLRHLADRLTIFRVNPELAFERSADGEFFLAGFLNKQADQISHHRFETFEYWLNELSLRSHSASFLKIFSLVKAKELNFGMGSFPQSSGLSYPYLTYKAQDGHYTYPSLTQLDKCLAELSARYKRTLASISHDISTNSESFLSPGYSCR